MKKIFKIIIFLIATLMLFLPISNVYADSLDSISADINSEIVRPGQEVTLNINFGEALGAYTFDIAYDNNIFEYVSASEGTPSDDSTKVRVVFHDSSGGTNPSENLKVTFKAKDGITTSNPTEFSITAEGLSNSDASVTYDDILTPIIKNVTVEPEYKDYEFKLDYTGDIYAGEEKEMTLSYSSSLGRYYEKARLIAEVADSQNFNVKLIGIDEYGGEENIIESGWGDPQGYKIGGKDVSQVLKLKGTFKEAKDYSITFKLIDRSNSDAVIAEKTFSIKVSEAQSPSDDNNTNNGDIVGEIENNVKDENANLNEKLPEDNSLSLENTNKVENNVVTEKPNSLPKTGVNIYIPIALIIFGLISFAIYFNRKK